MAAIIISIHKQYSDQLFNGDKRYEFRKNIPKQPIDKILVYEAKGCGKLVGELTVSQTISGSPEEVWNLTKEYSGIDENDFFKYYFGREKAYAFVISSALKYTLPMSLSELGISYPPQNYIYL